MISKTGNLVLMSGSLLLSAPNLSVANAKIWMRTDSLVIPAGGLQVAGLVYHVENPVQKTR